MESVQSSLRLRTVKKASQETGSSISFFKQLLRSGELKRYKVHKCTYVSMAEFEQLATQSQ